MEALKVAHPTLWLLAQVGVWALTVIAVLMTALANVTVPAELARANPRLASAVVLSRKLAPVLRGALKPLLGLALPHVAAQVVEELLGGGDTPSPPSGPEKKNP